MSSYHIINAVWVGIFPMLAVMVIIGILFYFICCINQIKNRIVQHRKRKSLKKARLKMMNDKSLKHGRINNQDEEKIYAKPDRSKLTLDLKNEYSPNVRRLSWKNNRKTGSAGDLYTTHPDTPIEDLIVQELNESPKSIYSRMQSLTNVKKSTEQKEEDFDHKQKESDVNSFNSYSDEDTINDYDNDSSSSNENRPKRKILIKDRIKKRNEKKKSKSSNQIKLLNDKYRTRLIDISKSNRLSSDIDYADEIFNDDDSLSSTGFNGPLSKSALMLYNNRNERHFSTIKESETASSLNVKSCEMNRKKFQTIESSGTISSLNKNKSPLHASTISKSLSLQKNMIINSSSISDMDPDDTILQDILVKTPKSINRKFVNFQS